MEAIGTVQLVECPDETWSRGFRFPTDPPTASQLKALRQIAIDMVRRQSFRRFQGLSAETIAESFNLGRTKAHELAKQARAPESPEATAILEILHGMMSEKLAGVLGHPHTADNRFLFGIVNDFDPSVYRSELPDFLRYPPLVPLPRDAHPVKDHAAAWMVIDDRGCKRVVNEEAVGGDDGTIWCKDWTAPSEQETLRMLLAAFRIDYRTWIRNRRGI